MTYTKLAEQLKVSRQVIAHRCKSLGIDKKELTPEEFEAIKEFPFKHKIERVLKSTNEESLIFDYFLKNKNNSTSQIANELNISVFRINYIINKCLKRGYVIYSSKINEL